MIATRRGVWARSRATGFPSIGVASLLLGFAAVVFATAGGTVTGLVKDALERRLAGAKVAKGVTEKCLPL